MLWQRSDRMGERLDMVLVVTLGLADRLIREISVEVAVPKRREGISPEISPLPLSRE